MKKLLLLTSLLLLNLPTYAGAKQGQDKGNGGDMCENNFDVIKEDINSWIVAGGAKGLKLGSVSLKDYKTKMTKNISNARVSCTSEKLMVGKAEKTCKNFIDDTGAARIVCNTSRFENTEVEEQYILVHHEYAGLSGIEVNVGEKSNYIISNQISTYLEEKVVKKLAVNNNGSIKKFSIEKFLKDANNPATELGKRILKINEETTDGRNNEGTIKLPITKADLQVVLVDNEMITRPWRFAEKVGKECKATGDSSTHLILLTANTGVHGAINFSTYSFAVTAHEALSAKTKNGEEPETCYEADDERYFIIEPIKYVVDKIKEVKLPSQYEE